MSDIFMKFIKKVILLVTFLSRAVLIITTVKSQTLLLLFVTSSWFPKILCGLPMACVQVCSCEFHVIVMLPQKH